MKILVSSDLHGSLSSARFLLDVVSLKKPDLVLLLGDFLYHGPRNPIPDSYDPQGTANALSSIAHLIVGIAGNCDSEVDSMLLPFPIAPSFSWIIANDFRIFATHGHKYTPDNLPLLQPGDIFLHGHTHIPMVRTHRGIYICNPGSLTLPKEHHPPSYGFFDDGVFSVYAITGELYLSFECF